MRVEPDLWLRSIFGYDVFRVSDFRLDSDNQNELNSAIQSSQNAFFFMKIPVGQSGVLRAALNLGFQIADINVTLERKPESLDPPKERPEYIIRDAYQNECTSVSEIAGVCFIRSRFHQDPRIPKDIANTIKRRWVENYFRGERGDSIIVAEVSGKPVGFLAIDKILDKNQEIRVIDLIGVHPKFHGRGIGKRMVNFFISDSVTKCNLLRVGTQIINLPSLHLYEKCGFRLSDSVYVLHAHVIDGKVLP